ncbi:bifunctional diaminohydroxyphosphoribosylaminopyrimidine deaminase/5-amino-6-(5-phosphoribosylamino)uracil reductase RibD [Pelagicoccus sp. SDUM812003]|uniref:bifunctional diaminohydroxyphosphoribosylaminopyrimidine deaminase/5-amino-6-(5-phosphoribosylamino)uracil reductase RibD n=1 Tax=Pelagicoccus sp. SDUM812003 TaxID=3041267 RepID=UPI00280CE93A|nr:bifunctional diaminohydroxyphosphoribosylaminopyrimidine deaminase/5-amino-6-(5-phosphoribosylamino)uracil reductase RibD [Pelagicoccus sp. SDUM812003]MDQ8201522.1 bifunctional diaminohydroxyphosphoribosylaminopyrimidine deaminase/5-amino-6-(5-phosphoribosylamino)uracil reductase RibD [Pelagicoccus sp. SDUM812003]
METKQQDESFMRAAICEAVKGDVVKTAPNPRVGAIVVERGEIVAMGHFEQDGGPHAERKAFDALGRKPAEGACLYVTLEPCSTQGRTGACTDAIVESGIRRVVIGAFDPTPDHQGNAVAILEQHGIEVVTDVLAMECGAINPQYRGHTTKAR